jgi:TolB-like protein
MKSFLISFFVILFLRGIASAQEKNMQAQKKKPTAAVLDFKVISGISKEESAALSSKFAYSFASTHEYTVVERGQMEGILKEQNMSMSDVCNGAECAVEIGKLLSAEKMVVGDIGKIGETYTVTIKLIDVTTGKVESTVNEEYAGKAEGLLGVFDVMAQKLTGTYKSSHTFLYVLGGVAVVGGGAAVLLGGGKKAAAAVSTALGGINDLPLPPH